MADSGVEHLQQRPRGPQSLNYLFSTLLQKKLVSAWYRRQATQRSLGLGRGREQSIVRSSFSLEKTTLGKEESVS